MNDAVEPSRAFVGRWSDGKRAVPRSVAFVLGRELVLRDDEGVELARHPLEAIRVSEPLRLAPRLFDLPDGSVLAVEESAPLVAALQAAGHRDSPVVAWQRAWPGALLALVALAAASIWIYREGLPRASDWAASHLSPALEARMGDQALAALDRSLLAPSKLSAAKQAEIARRLHGFESAAGIATTRRIVFRSSGAGGRDVNAFSLPGDTIVLLDGLVAFAGTDDEMLAAVLAHEAGHQARHHMTRGLFSALGTAALAGMLWGDYSSVASNAAFLAGQLKYSRDDEREADDDAVAALQHAGRSPAALARFFAKLEDTPEGRARLPSWASTHPDFEERRARALDGARAFEAASSSAGR